MRKIISLICLLLPVLTMAAQSSDRTDMGLDVRNDAPDRHIVVKGDTLWDISGKFFNDPWKWPHIWGLNKESINNPHWIYPGDIILLDRESGTLRIEQAESAAIPDSSQSETIVTPSTDSNVVKLSPRIRVNQSDRNAIPSIPAKAIEPFLSKPLVVDEEELEGSPTLIGAREGRVILGSGDTGFVKQMPDDQGTQWMLYRPGKTFVDPDTDEELGIEAIYLGNAEVRKFAEVSTVAITYTKQEIYPGDRLVVPAPEDFKTYLPRAPEIDISAQIISIYGGVLQGGQNSVITLNKGAREGVENGHVLALYRKGETVRESSVFWDNEYKLPDERYGLAFVFRVFDKVSYALVMQTRLPVQILDRANTP
ncbi:MAG: LysM peptidoglycan-binding domain-containing protein [Gallionella sp.]